MHVIFDATQLAPVILGINRLSLFLEWRFQFWFNQ